MTLHGGGTNDTGGGVPMTLHGGGTNDTAWREYQ